ncbi:MAG: AraC family transcriptional regulator [Cytophagales bacterium]|nr:AraC family transcriptional regulator [Cytophagales bacterium]
MQGIFLVLVLFSKKHSYQKVTFWLLIGCLISTILFALGDDNYNLFTDNSDWFFFHEPLITTFLVLFIKYKISEKRTFVKKDALLFLPYTLYLVLESISSFWTDNSIIDFFDNLVEASFIILLLHSIYTILKSSKEKWLLIFIIPFTLIFLIDEVFTNIFPHDYFSYIDSYGMFLISIFLFYLLTYRLITSPNKILSEEKSEKKKYKSPNFSNTEAETIIKKLDNLMTEKKLFTNQKLTVNKVATQLGIPRQYLSEILNVHLGIRFQDYLNKYRIEEFIKCLHQENYKNYTLVGIATEVGFNSKSSFNSTFKKMKGMTPSEYKKNTKQLNKHLQKVQKTHSAPL